MTVYIDVLLLLNFYIDYLLILLCEKLSGIHIKFARRVGAALWSALFSLTVLLPPMSLPLTLLTKAACVMSTVFVGFGRRHAAMYFKLCAYYIVFTYVVAGGSAALIALTGFDKATVRNSSVYFDVSPLLLIGATTAVYVLLGILKRLLPRSAPSESQARISLAYGSSAVSVTALIDSGNLLKDPISGDEVSVIDSATAFALTGMTASQLMSADSHRLNGFRLIPYSAVGGSGVLPSFRVDTMTVGDKKSAAYSRVLVAVSPSPLKSGYSAILPDIYDEKGER